MMRPHSLVGIYDQGGTATILGIALLLLAVVVGILLDSRHDRSSSHDTMRGADDIESDAELWTFP